MPAAGVSGTALVAAAIGTTVQAYDADTTKNDTANTFTAIQKWAKGVDVVSANALTLGTDGNYFDITGTTTITSIGTVGVGTVVRLHFDGALTLTHHSTDLVLPGAANITTAAGDEAEFVEYATGDWRCTSYTKASGTAVVGSGNHGQCILGKDGANLKLLPKNGNSLIINGVACTVPSAGVTLAAPATSGTTYLIYAYMNSGTMTLEASATAHATDATTGVEIKSGDATRTLVGIARTVSSAWVDSAAQRFVRSYFNRPAVDVVNAFTATRSTTSLSATEINTEIRNEFVCWADDSVSAHITGQSTNNTTNVSTYQAIGWDGVVDANTYTGAGDTTAGLLQNAAVSGTHVFAEGYHYTTLMGVVASASTGSWQTALAGVYNALRTHLGAK